MNRFLLHLLMCYLIDCTYYASPYMINCIDMEDCLISCEGTQSCMNSIINCPKIGDCNIECIGERACQHLIINATHSLGNLNIKCDTSTHDCRGIKIYGSKLDTSLQNLNMSCGGEFGSCINSEVHCPSTGDCDILCTGDSSCESSNIYGPLNGDLIISCNNYQSCYDSIFNGEYSHEMEIKGCIATDSCLELEVHCPPATNNSPHCFLEGNNNLGGDVHGHGMEIYAINGWKDVIIDYFGGIINNNNDNEVIGHMHCGYGYNIPCDILMNWECSNIDDYCNNNIQTDIPTQKQTLIPTSPPCNNNNNNNNDNSYQTMGIETTENIFKHNVKFIDSLQTQLERMHGPMGMIIVGALCILLAICCIIIGNVRKSFVSEHQINISNQSKQNMIDVVEFKC